MQPVKILAPVLLMGSTVLGSNQAQATTGTSPMERLYNARFEQFKSIDDVVELTLGKTIETSPRNTVGAAGSMEQTYGGGRYASSNIGLIHPPHASMNEALSGYDITVQRVHGLEYVEDEGEGPSAHALSLALDFLSQVEPSLSDAFPKGASAVRDDGSVDVFWRRRGFTVQLTVPAQEDRPVSVYHRNDSDHGTARDASPPTLAYWLNRFARA